MNAETWQQLKELFHAAVELAPHDREAFLNTNCAGDDELYREVAALLSAHESAGDFIQQPAMVDVGFVATDEQAGSQATIIGQQIGSYQIIRELGRGGMGSVYLAARADESFDKQVALKLIKRGMDSEAIIVNKMSMGRYRHIPVRKSDGSYSVISIKHVLKYIAKADW